MNDSENINPPKETPTKILEETLPIPKLPVSTVKRKQVACILTSPENISFKKTKNAVLIKRSHKNMDDAKSDKKSEKKNGKKEIRKRT